MSSSSSPSSSTLAGCAFRSLRRALCTLLNPFFRLILCSLKRQQQQHLSAHPNTPQHTPTHPNPHHYHNHSLAILAIFTIFTIFTILAKLSYRSSSVVVSLPSPPSLSLRPLLRLNNMSMFFTSMFATCWPCPRCKLYTCRYFASANSALAVCKIFCSYRTFSNMPVIVDPATNKRD